MFLEIVSALSSFSSITGISVKDIVTSVSNQDKRLIEDYFTYLEGKRVLVAPFDNEVCLAVIASLESIKNDTEQLRLKVKSQQTQHFLLDLIYTLSNELMLLHKSKESKGNVFFYKSLQRIRVKFARVLAVLCYQYKIDLSIKETGLAHLVLEHAYRVR